MKENGNSRHPTRTDGTGYPAPQDESLPGEDSRSVYLEDAMHWMSVYDELLSFTRAIAAEAPVAGPRGIGSDAGRDDGLLDVAGLVARYEERHRFWQGRAQELAAHNGH